MIANITSFYTAGKWAEKAKADILLLQETHVAVDGVRSAAAQLRAVGWDSAWSPALPTPARKQVAGLAVIAKKPRTITPLSFT
eukprot:383354-Lingulodinium_polyedra.AAC.1